MPKKHPFILNVSSSDYKTTEIASDATVAGRERVAKVAEANNEFEFARQVRGGCWDDRNDVKGCIAEANGGPAVKLKGE